MGEMYLQAGTAKERTDRVDADVVWPVLGS